MRAQERRPLRLSKKTVTTHSLVAEYKLYRGIDRYIDDDTHSNLDEIRQDLAEI